MYRTFFEKPIKESIQLLYENDKDLILLDKNAIQRINALEGTAVAKTYYHAAERAVAFRFGLYLYQKLRGYLEEKKLDMDMEYNRHMNGKKTTKGFPKGISPDLNIHNRGNDSYNILVVEFKTWWNKDKKDKDDLTRTLLQRDYDKLKDLTTLNSNEQLNYQYQFGLSIIFEKKVECCLGSLKWFPESN